MVIKLVTGPAIIACIGVRLLGAVPMKPATMALVLKPAPTNVPSTASGCVRATAGNNAAITIQIPAWNGVR